MLTDPEVATVKDAFTRTRDKALFILVLKTGLRYPAAPSILPCAETFMIGIAQNVGAIKSSQM
jgi:hypothetical protein